MGIEDLRARQRRSIMRSQERQLGLDYLRSTEMKHENVERIRTSHSEYFHPSVGDVPDGWVELVLAFLRKFADLGEDMMSPGSVHFGRTKSGLKVFFWANPEMQWSADKAQAVIGLQHHLYTVSQETCEWCGKGYAGPVPLGDHVTFFLCEEDAASAREKLAANVAAFDERVRFRGEVSVLFQEHSLMSLHVSGINMPIMRKALRDIKRIVEERDLVGQVYITKVAESEGQLFINARCSDKVDPATQFEVAEIVHHAQWQSDQASLAANKEGPADDA